MFTLAKAINELAAKIHHENVKDLPRTRGII